MIFDNIFPIVSYSEMIAYITTNKILLKNALKKFFFINLYN